MSDRLILVAMALGLAAGCGIPKGVAGSNEDPPPASAAPAPNSNRDVEPVTVVVIDHATKQPVEEFTYLCSFEASDRRGSSARQEPWCSVRSAAGTFVIQAPSSCQLSIRVMSREARGGHGFGDFSFSLKSSDKERRLVIELALKLTVEGTVRDSRTKQPIAGATVAPVIVTSSLRSPDLRRATTTGPDGRFVLTGVDPSLGVSVSHPDFLRDNDQGSGREAAAANLDLFLRRGETVRGTVHSRDGKRLEGVKVSDGAGKTVQSARDGTFVLQNPSDTGNFGDPYTLTFDKEGYDWQILRSGSIFAGALLVTLDAAFRLVGQVLTAEGTPAEEFTLVTSQGRNRAPYDCISQQVHDQTGRFRRGLKAPGMTRVGVRAKDHAVWDEWVTVTGKGPPLKIRLERGATVSGKVIGPATTSEKWRADLILEREKRQGPFIPVTPIEDLSQLTTEVAADGSLRFGHVRPGRYQLRITGRGLTPLNQPVVVPAAGLNVGEVSVRGTGRIAGWVYNPEKGGIWALARGNVRSPSNPGAETMEFTTDKNGYFVVDGVPVGKADVSVSIQYADIIWEHTESAEVVEGKTTEGRFFAPKVKK